MAIDTITPAATSLVEPGDSFSFTVDNTYTTMTIEVETDSGWEYAYDSSLSGAQSGYTVSVTVSGSRHIFVVTRDLGWNLSPTSIRVIENETGSSATTTTNYVLATATSYPQTSTPYYINPSMTNAKFTDLLDTPASYAGEALKVYRVNAAETALEAYTPSSSTGDVAGPASAGDNNIAAFDTTTGKLIKDSTVDVDTVVVGPASAVGDNIAVFDSTTGKLIKDGGASVASLSALGGTSHLQFAWKWSPNQTSWLGASQDEGPFHDAIWTQTYGSALGDPSLPPSSMFWYNHPIWVKDSVLQNVYCNFFTGATFVVEIEVWGIQLTDGVATTAAAYLVAQGTKSVNGNKRWHTNLTLVDPTIPANTMLVTVGRIVSGAASTTGKCTIDFEWTD